MSSKALRTYLNDHLAGSVAAVELLDHLADLHSDPEGKRFFTELRAEVEEDQEVLQQLLETVGGKESAVRKAAAWNGSFRYASTRPRIVWGEHRRIS